MSALIKRIEVYPRTWEFRTLDPSRALALTQAYHIQTERTLERSVLEEVFVDPVLAVLATKTDERKALEHSELAPQFCVEIAFRPGVTDNSGASASEALSLFGCRAQVGSRQLAFFLGEWQRDEVEAYARVELCNELIQEVRVFSWADFQQRDPFLNPSFPSVQIEQTSELFELIDLKAPLDDLVALSDERCLALSREELSFLQDVFSRPEVIKAREQRGLSEKLTDVEIEIIAQSWSEHCKHKIFAADIDYEEAPEAPLKIGAQKVSGLYPTYIKKTTKEIKHPWLISVFSDNAGIVRFDSKLDACIKVETHNSPSALDPYGGALTGILGVNRDILGTGLGARPVANMDVFCFAPPSWPLQGSEEFMPRGLMEPRRLLAGVHKGVEDGGNKSGIPTLNGSIHFDQDYAGKPLVFVGTVGLMPQTLPSGKPSSKKGTQVGDKIVVIGGAVGADGIHGATFSSLELNESAPATAVQIGDPLTQKRVLDLLMEARDQELYSGITDNGAGGLSSSLGEMATLTGGAVLDLARCPTKYPGLKPFELMISESQERMSLSVHPDKVDRFLALCEQRGVGAHVLGEFTHTGHLEVFYGERLVACLNLHFLHEELPKMNLRAHWKGPLARHQWMPTPPKKRADKLDQVLLTLLSSPNIASKERLVRQYDHEVQGASAMKPFIGHGPSDAGAVWLGPHGGDESGALVISHGLAPRLSLIDPLWMAYAAVDEAVRSAVVAGADPQKLCLLDNFCWPDPVASPKNPEGEEKLAALVRACHGLREICLTYQTPLVSGKDSMKNDFRGKNRRGEPLVISILPTLLVTAMGRAEVEKLVTTPFKQAGDLILLLGGPQKTLMGTELEQHYEVNSEPATPLSWDLQGYGKLYQTYHSLVQKGFIQSGHDLSEGGLAVAVAESLIGAPAGLGAALELAGESAPLVELFSEGPGQLLVSVRPEHRQLVEKELGELPHYWLGTVTQKEQLKVGSLLEVSRVELLRAFTQESFR